MVKYDENTIFLGEGYVIGYWGFSEHNELNKFRYRHIKYNDVPFCGRKLSGMTKFYAVSIVLPQAEIEGNLCMDCVKKYSEKFHKKSLVVRMGL